MFGYVFRELVVADRRLPFEWRSSPRFLCMFSAALEHAHRHTSYDDTVVMDRGRTATEHVSVTRREQQIGRLRCHLVVRSPVVGEGRRGAFSLYYTA